MKIERARGTYEERARERGWEREGVPVLLSRLLCSTPCREVVSVLTADEEARHGGVEQNHFFFTIQPQNNALVVSVCVALVGEGAVREDFKRARENVDDEHCDEEVLLPVQHRDAQHREEGARDDDDAVPPLDGVGEHARHAQARVPIETGSFFRLIDSCITQLKA